MGMCKRSGLLIRGHFWLISSLIAFLMWLVGDLLHNNRAMGFLIIPLMALTAFRSEVIRGVGLILKSQWPDGIAATHR